MADNKNLPDQNCTLYIDSDGRLWLFWISSIDNLVRSYFLKYRYSTNYEEDGPPVWNWQDAIFCRPKDAETVFVKNLDKQIEQTKASTQISKERQAAFLSRIEERRDVYGDKLNVGFILSGSILAIRSNPVFAKVVSDRFLAPPNCCRGLLRISS
jgi:hypothetical protein